MTAIKRRNFLKGMLGYAAAAGLSLPSGSRAATKRVVIVGGGTGGATVAKYLKRADPGIEVRLIEKSPVYTTCYMSNEVLSGVRPISSLQFTYDALAAYGILVSHDEVTAIDPIQHKVITATGTEYVYDRCIVAPGIDFQYESIAGYDETTAESIPHAWKAGDQTLILRQQLMDMSDGGTVVIAAPPNPYRCPPAPYERASQIALYLQRNKPNSKVIILDPKTAFAKQDLFMQGWTELYGYQSANSLIDWVSADNEQARVTQLNAATKTVTTQSGEHYQADVINLIPAQKAGKIAFIADLADDSGWCPVNPQSFESTRYQDIHVIGDACAASSLPKSGFAANSEGKACASAVAALLNGDSLPNPSFTNACYSIVGSDLAISISAIYRLADDGSSIIKVPASGGVSASDASESQRKLDVQYTYSWYNNFTADVFK